ncbi:MAG: 1-acyl-sn-glycerol-3-phosphate acyltransferase [Defluviitaleaceae bacterium]|nr:1-acyl-sn-glycerol-3-phosphate acyltransferase [Defluviitaleaceae bacterium]
MFYRFARRIALIFGHILYRFTVSGQEHIPQSGAVIICSNHIHGMDALALAMFSKRQIFFMGKKELFDRPILGPLLRKLGAFQVDRAGNDLQAYRHTMQILKEDKALGIFSQGTRAQEFDNVKGGVAVFALKSGAPVVPVGIRGTYRFFSRLHVHFGPPITMDKYQGRKIKSDLVDEVMTEIVSHVSALTLK